VSLLVADPTMTVYPQSSSGMASSTPVMVTVCGVDHVAFVNVSELGDTVPSNVLDEEIGTMTLACGGQVRRTEKVAVPPASLVMRAAAVTKNPGTSSS